MLHFENILQNLTRLTRSKFSKLEPCNWWHIYFSLLNNSASHLDWGWLTTGLDFLRTAPRKELSTTPSLLPTKRPLFQVRFRQCVTFDVLPAFQFTICSSLAADALLTGVSFFQLLRQSGKPWISLMMEPAPRTGGLDNLFKLTVLWPPESRFISET